MPEQWTLRDRVFFLALALMEAAWLAALIPVLVPRGRALSMFWLLLGMWVALVGGAWFIGRLALSEREERQVWAAMVVVPLVVYVIAARIVLFPHARWDDLHVWRMWLLGPFDVLHIGEPTGMLVLVILWWWRCLGVAQPPTGSMYLGMRFRAEMLGLLVGIVLGHSLYGGVSVLNVWVFFFAGLLALTLERIRGVGLLPQDRERVFDRTWVLITLGSTFLTVGISALVARVATVDNALRVLGALQPVWRVIEYLLLALALVIGWVVGSIVGFLWHLFLGNTRIEVNFSPLQVPQAPPAQPPTPVQWPSWISWGMAHLRVVGGFVFVLLLLALIAVALRREVRRRTPVQEEVGPAGDVEEMAVDVGRGVRSLWERIKTAWHYARQYGVSPTFLAALSVHNIYVNLLRLSAQVGYARQEAETPYEHLRRLTAAYPAVAGDLQAIVDAFVAAHYGDLMVGSDELSALRDAWVRVRQSVEAAS